MNGKEGGISKGRIPARPNTRFSYTNDILYRVYS